MSEFQAVRCYNCKAFQSLQVIKAKKWQCRRCGEKQSFGRVYFKSISAAQVREAIVQLSEKQREIDEKQEAAAADSRLRQYEHTHPSTDAVDGYDARHSQLSSFHASRGFAPASINRQMHQPVHANIVPNNAMPGFSSAAGWKRGRDEGTDDSRLGASTNRHLNANGGMHSSAYPAAAADRRLSEVANWFGGDGDDDDVDWPWDANENNVNGCSVNSGPDTETSNAQVAAPGGASHYTAATREGPTVGGRYSYQGGAAMASAGVGDDAGDGDGGAHGRDQAGPGDGSRRHYPYGHEANNDRRHNHDEHFSSCALHQHQRGHAGHHRHMMGGNQAGSAALDDGSTANTMRQAPEPARVHRHQHNAPTHASAFSAGVSTVRSLPLQSGPLAAASNATANRPIGRGLVNDQAATSPAMAGGTANCGVALTTSTTAPPSLQAAPSVWDEF